MKSFQDLFVESQKSVVLQGTQKSVSILRKEYEDEALSTVYPEALRAAMSSLSLEEQLSACMYLDAFECGTMPKERLSEDYPLLSPEEVNKHWSRYTIGVAELAETVLATEGGLLLGICVQNKILWLGGEISYRTTAWSEGDNNGAGYKGAGYYEATKYLTMLYRPTLLFSDVVLDSSYALEEKRVILPDGVKKIQSGAFAGREALEEIVFPEGLEKIGYQSFKGCVGLKSIVIPASVQLIGSSAFADCVGLECVEIKGALLLDSMAFRGCKCLKKVILPDAEITLDGWTFSECESLSEIVNAQSIKNLCEYAFYGCRSLSSIALSDTVYYIPTSACSHCESLKSIVLPHAVGSIGSYAFAFCTALEEIVMSEKVWDICNDAFMDCLSLRRVTLPSSVKEEFEKAAPSEILSSICYTEL